VTRRMTQNANSAQEKSELTGEQQQAALCLAQGFTIKKTAQDVGVAPITISRWKRESEFQNAVRSIEDELYQDQLRSLKNAAGVAIATLLECCNGKVSHYVRVQSASKLLDLGLQVHKTEQLEAEIERLQAIIAQDDE
jgi:predicted site-specific integrase-resolvase